MQVINLTMANVVLVAYGICVALNSSLRCVKSCMKFRCANLAFMSNIFPGACDWAQKWGWYVAQTSFTSQVSFFFFFLLLLLLLLSSHAGMFVYIFKNVLFWNTISFFLTRSSTTPSRNFTTSPKLSSNASPTVTNGDSNCSPGYTLNSSTSSSNRQGTFSDLLFLPSLLLFIETLPLMDKYWQSL